MSAVELLEDIENRLEIAHEEALDYWHLEDHDRVLAVHRAKIAKMLEEWRDGNI